MVQLGDQGVKRTVGGVHPHIKHVFGFVARTGYDSSTRTMFSELEEMPIRLQMLSEIEFI